MRLFALSAAVVLVAGCASQSSPAPATSAEAPPASHTAVPAAAPVAAKKAPPSTVQEAMKAGYKIVDKDGKTMYCREQTQTGSRVQRETICLTEAQLEAARQASKRNLEQLAKPVPPPQGM